MKKLGNEQILIYIIFFLNMIMAAYKLIAATVIKGDSVLWNIGIALSMVCLYGVYKWYRFDKFHLEILILLSMIPMAYILSCYILGDQIKVYFPYLAEDTGRIASLLIFIAVIDLFLYIDCQDKVRSYFYIAVAVLDYVCMALNDLKVSQWILLGVFIAYPIMLRPIASKVKKIMMMCLIYMLILSNMCLITNYTDIFRVAPTLDLEHSLNIDLVIAVGGYIFFKYWDRIPEDIDLNALVMRRFHKVLKMILTAYIGAFVLLMAGGSYWTQLKDTMGMEFIKGFGIPLAESVSRLRNGLFVLADQCGIVTVSLYALLLIVFINKARRNMGFDKSTTIVFSMLFGVYLIEIMFWMPGIACNMLYTGAMAMAAGYIEKYKHVESFGVRFEIKEKEENGKNIT